MARLVIDKYEERVLFPDLPVKHYRVYVSLITANGDMHPTWCEVAKEHGSSTFDFTCFDNPAIDEFDYRNKYKMSEQVLKWCETNVK